MQYLPYPAVRLWPRMFLITKEHALQLQHLLGRAIAERVHHCRLCCCACSCWFC
jgi:hypothetical protein